MNNRPRELFAPIKKYAPTALVGTIGNIIGILSTLPLTYAFTKKQMPNNTQSYSQLFRFIRTKDGMHDVYKVSRHVLKMAPKQSLAYLGVTNIGLEQFKDDKPIIRGLKIGVLSATAESMVTSLDMQKTISGWGNSSTAGLSKQTVFWRSTQATLLKNLAANPVTLICMLHTRSYIDKHLQLPSIYSSALSAMIGSCIASGFITPFVTLQTRTLNNPAYSMSYHAKDIAKQSLSHFYTGGIGRVVQKSLQAGIAFFAMEAGNNFIYNRKQILTTSDVNSKIN